MGGGAAAVGSVLGSSLGKAAKRKRGGRSIVKQRADQRRARKTRSLAKAAKGRIRKIGKRLAKKR